MSRSGDSPSIEIMLVVVIIGVLAALIVPNIRLNTVRVKMSG